MGKPFGFVCDKVKGNMTKKTKIKICAVGVAVFTIFPIVQVDIVGIVVGAICFAVLSFWSWDTLN